MSGPANSIEELSRKVELLERQHHRGRILLIIVLVVIALVPITWFAKESQSLESKSFVLVDDSGKQRAILSVSADGSPSLVFYDARGKISAMLHTKATGIPTFGLFSSAGDTLFRAP
jgi:hypothetical protein